MIQDPELEIGLGRRDGGGFTLELRLNDPSDPEVRAPQRATVYLDPAKLRSQDPGAVAYGQTLTGILFSDAEARSYFREARKDAKGRTLRLRLLIDRTASDLHSVYWETLRDPEDGSWLAINENLLFSRLLASTRWEQVELRAKSELRALVAIANPTDLEDYETPLDRQPLAPINVEAELERARQALGDIPLSSLTSNADQGQWVTTNRLIDALRQGPDILYLVCHGALDSQEDRPGPYLWLEGEDGTAEVVSGQIVAERIAALPANLRPRLAVLASCESAGKGQAGFTSDAQGALAAFGPLLAQAGIPAVVAMQGRVSMDTMAEFMPVFFRELRQDGQIDRAMAAARGTVSQRDDAWMPVLFMRLRDASLWYVPGFAGGAEEDFAKWESLSEAVLEGSCTAIVGPGITEALIGPRRNIALRWAEKHGYPFSPSDQEDLPRIAQYVRVWQDPAYLYRAYRQAVRDELEHRYPAAIPPELTQAKRWNAEQIDEVLSSVAKTRWDEASPGPIRLLARLRLPIYITATQSDLLSKALEEEGAKPQVCLCPWNSEIPPEEYRVHEKPSRERPLVYHLFGHLKLPESLVITEDDYLDYVIGVKDNWDLLPESLKGALYRTSLLFLGFSMDDWAFRAFFRILVNGPSYARLAQRSHVAVQIEPEDGQIQNVQRARKYIEDYLGDPFSLYMGSPEEFLQELVTHVAEA